jgi:hypothetical protein
MFKETILKEDKQPSPDTMSLINETVLLVQQFGRLQNNLQEKIELINESLKQEEFSAYERRQLFDQYLKPHYKSRTYYIGCLPKALKRHYEMSEAADIENAAEPPRFRVKASFVAKWLDYQLVAAPGNSTEEFRKGYCTAIESVKGLLFEKLFKEALPLSLWLRENPTYEEYNLDSLHKAGHVSDVLYNELTSKGTGAA